jgi:plastocyanin
MRIAAALAAVALTVAGLGLGASAGAHTGVAARSVEVTVGDDFFKPRKLSVVTGTRVHWVWRGQSEHNVTVTSGPVRFHSHDKTSGDYSRTLRKPGTYKIICTIHGFRMRIKAHRPG